MTKKNCNPANLRFREQIQDDARNLTISFRKIANEGEGFCSKNVFTLNRNHCDGISAVVLSDAIIELDNGILSEITQHITVDPHLRESIAEEDGEPKSDNDNEYSVFQNDSCKFFHSFVPFDDLLYFLG